MGLKIVPPSPDEPRHHDPTVSCRSPSSISSDDDEGSSRPTKRARLTATSLVTPGETITTEQTWMRGHGTYTLPTSSSIHATLAGTLVRTNKLLSVTPLRARYIPSIGDLVIGRIVEVQSRRWKVDISAPLLAQLPLSSINLPGGVLRRRTTADELQMRQFFNEGELVLAEVQAVGQQDGTAGLHTRSLRYGKLKNGVFVQVLGSGSGPGVVRGKRQSFTVGSAGAGAGTGAGAGEVDVVLGVNGFCWVSAHVEPPTSQSQPGSTSERQQQERLGTGSHSTVSITSLEEQVSTSIYSSQNDIVSPSTRREITRIVGVIRALADGGIKVDEDSVTRGYNASLELELELDGDNHMKGLGDVEDEDEEGMKGIYLGGEVGRRVCEMVGSGYGSISGGDREGEGDMMDEGY
ncbi:putative exosome complex exonuclease rrp4 [Phaeomoniella chlamydospora]|uniref:Putative exosome complex exonuclease rrp4 n=1 Tax=Phaeomoniella chlamydospora TaxID=158046 RepID=A0A0G2E815_PHACM|nr:putative exosome complex exonuclease rrp4 [Phaeomoniella chlamydospora]